tara:strand:+ start:17523 stop:18380 length:858 start_codon:yes stop_codon:yes gene_type:complete
MTVIKKLKDLDIILNKSPRKKILGLVPTMGSIHNGHISLIKSALKYSDDIWVSIFVNPTQFNDINDYKKYPVNFKQDINIIKSINQNINIFLPSIDDIYGKKIIGDKFNLDGIDKILEGIKRPGHFNGVATIVKKLFQIFNPNFVFFGEKDFQQTMIVQKIIDSYFKNIKMHVCPTIREKNGLALSSRNSLLSKQAKKNISIIYDSLLFAKQNFYKFSQEELKKIIKINIEKNKGFFLEYFELRCYKTLKICNSENKKNSHCRAFICVIADGVRLIDNLLISNEN